MMKNAPEEMLADRLWIGLDVGGTKIEAVAVDAADRLRGRVRIQTGAGSEQESVGSIVRAIEALLAESGAARGQVAAIGVGIPGMVNGGVVSLAVNLNLTSFPLAEYLSARFGVPVLLENDVRAAALGAYDWLHRQWPGTGSMVYLSIGTGIACGVVLDGRLHRGVNGLAGEVGHIVSDPRGPACKCGNRGCLETIASGPAIARAAERAARGQRDSRLHGQASITSEAVFIAAGAGDELARAVVRRAAAAVARAIYNLLLAYDPDVIALGGGVAQAGNVFFDPVRAEIERMAGQIPLAKTVFAPTGRQAAPSERVLLLPADAIPPWHGMIVLAKGVHLEH